MLSIQGKKINFQFHWIYLKVDSICDAGKKEIELYQQDLKNTF